MRRPPLWLLQTAHPLTSARRHVTTAAPAGGAPPSRPWELAPPPHSPCGLAGASTRRRPGQSPRHASVGRADDDAPRGTRDEALREQDNVPRGTTGRPRLPGWPRFPRSDTRGHCSSRVCTLSAHAHASDTDRQVGLPIGAATGSAGQQAWHRLGAVRVPRGTPERRSAGPPPRPRTDLGSLSFTPCPAQTGRASAVGHSGTSEARFRGGVGRFGPLRRALRGGARAFGPGARASVHRGPLRLPALARSHRVAHTRYLVPQPTSLQ